MKLNRRGFVGGLATFLGYAGLRPPSVLGQVPARRPADRGAAFLTTAARDRVAEYDPASKLGNNENPWGPLDSVKEAMNSAWKYSNRYGYPDGGLVQAIAAHHGIPQNHILHGAGSGEILDVVGMTFLNTAKKVLDVEPTYSRVYDFV